MLKLLNFILKPLFHENRVHLRTVA